MSTSPAIVTAPVIRAAPPRDDVRVTLLDQRIFSAPIGTAIGAILVGAGIHGAADTGPICAAMIENDLRELTFPVTRDCNVRPVTLTESDGGRIYRRTLVFVMIVAAYELFPEAKIAVENSMTVGGFYCRVLNRPPFTPAEIDRLRERMQAIIAEDARVFRMHMPLAEAVTLFASRNEDDKVRLLEYRTKDYLTVYTLHGYTDYFYGYMLPSTGALTIFDVERAEEDGLYLRFPRPEAPNRLMPMGPMPQIERVFRQTDDWLHVMGIEDIGQLNRAISDDRFREVVLINEALHSRRLGEIADQIARRYEQGARLVLIAGPSSAGKTTFSKRLGVQLMAYGIRPFTLAMDNYFVERASTPRDETGAYDFEALEALNRVLLNDNLLALMNGERVQIPRFDFREGRSTPGDIAHLSSNSMIIAEGIHGLNPALLPNIPPERVFRLYVSPLTALNTDRNNRIPTTDVRLLRRMVRDYMHRGYSALDTLSRWESVRRGEKRNIFPHQDNADAVFNSSLAYELAVIRPFAEPLLRQIDAQNPRYTEAKRLLAFLGWVRPASPEFVPGDSLLREFVGGSVLEDYTPGVIIAGRVRET
jgi:uridine kinase